MASVNVETEIELLKREVSDMKQIHVRFDTAIEKIALNQLQIGLMLISQVKCFTLLNVIQMKKSLKL